MMNRPEDAVPEDEDDIGVLIYQHAKREAKAAAAASLSQETHRRSARIKRAVGHTKPSVAAHTDVQCPRSARIKPVVAQTKAKSNRSKLQISKSSSGTRLRRVSNYYTDAWFTRYNELVKYKRELGNCDVPKGYKPNLQLGKWVHRQRDRFKDKLLSEDRIAKLNEIGFAWDAWSRVSKYYTDAWFTRYNELMEYKRETGNCDVPKGYKPNLQMGKWVHKQRERFKDKLLSEDRIAKLNEIGFVWDWKAKREVLG
jgi:hypothetical protein